MRSFLVLQRAASVGIIIVVSTAACGHQAPTPAWQQEAGYRWRELSVPNGHAGFTHMEGRRSGVRFANDVSDSLLLRNRLLGQGAGVALGDVDGDGRVDIFLARTDGCSALYRNLGDFRFEDATKTSGIGACDRHSSGTALADVDGDGDLDLILLATRGPNAIFINDGKGQFAEHRDLGLDSTGRGGTAVTLADVDGDGRLDLYVANYKAYSFDDSVPPRERLFGKMVRQTPSGRYEIVPEFRGEYRLVNRPDMGGLRLTVRGEPDEFYVNEGGRFSRAPTAARFRDARGRPLSEETESFTLDARFADLNGDGAPDLYVANDFEDPDQLWWNDGHGSFRLADWTTLRQLSNAAMGLDVADVNGDGLPDVFVVDMLSNDSHRLKTQIPTNTALPKQPGDLETQLQHQRNTLFVNRGDSTFVEAGMFAGVQASGWSWSTMFMDADLDGWQDILIANGHLWDIMDADVQERFQKEGDGGMGEGDGDWRRLRSRFPKLELKNVAFRNRGDLTFEDVSARWGFGTENDISNAMAAADLDGDGDLDVVVNRLGASALVLKNNSAAPRVAVRLIGDAPNTHAVGAKITLQGGAVALETKEVAAGGLYMSHSDYEASFAMGKSDSATLVVDWRDGRRTTLHGIRPNRLYEITAATATARERAADSVRLAKASPLFEDATALLGGHVHIDPRFDDWQQQPLLPNALSQLGPGVSWFDIDRDGDEDLIIGTGRTGHIAVFRNDGGRFVALPTRGPAASADLTTVLGMASLEGERLVVGVSGWERPGVYGAVTMPVTREGAGDKIAPAVPQLPSATGPMVLGDYDGDGDLDLFIGGRAIPARYPEAASSTLFKNEGGKFVLDTANSRLLDKLGLVSAALFSDIDGDGRPDLMVARDWGSIALFLNRGGTFVAAPESWGLNRMVGRWNGLASGDLDGDGRLDLVATNWGRNTATPADSERPLVMVHGPFGRSGDEELLLARQDSRLRALAPLNGYAGVRGVIPELSRRVSTFAAYADATLAEVLGPFATNTKRVSVTSQDHVVLFNRGDHFEARPLPADAQLAPAFFAGIADFDGDGSEDVFLSQNFYPTALGMPRYDGGRGILLSGDGKGGLKPLSGASSGIEVYGDQRGAAFADFDRDGRLDLAVSQNGSTTRLFHNRSAKPGLRVRVQGPPSNPDGVGAQIRIVYAGGRTGPVREVQAGSGYWSQNGAVQVFGLSSQPESIWVRWPGGAETREPVPPAAREVVVSRQAR